MKQQDSPPFKSRNQTALVWWWFLRKGYVVNLVRGLIALNLNTSIENFGIKPCFGNSWSTEIFPQGHFPDFLGLSEVLSAFEQLSVKVSYF